MADVTSLIETMENRWMRAWVRGDTKELKALTARDFILLTATKPPAILDRPSWLDAAGKRYLCSAYRFGEVYVRDWGQVALFTSPLELDAMMDDQDWSGRGLIALAIVLPSCWLLAELKPVWRFLNR